VNPEGPNGEPNALAGARDIRETFARPATAVELVFGANSQLRAISEVYGSDDAELQGSLNINC